MEPDLSMEMENIKQRASGSKYQGVINVVPPLFHEFSYSIADCQNWSRRESQRFPVLNPSHSVILKDSYLPLICFDLHPVGKCDRDTQKEREKEKTERQSSKRQRLIVSERSDWLKLISTFFEFQTVWKWYLGFLHLCLYIFLILIRGKKHIHHL